MFTLFPTLMSFLYILTVRQNSFFQSVKLPSNAPVFFFSQPAQKRRTTFFYFFFNRMKVVTSLEIEFFFSRVTKSSSGAFVKTSRLPLPPDRITAGNTTARGARRGARRACAGRPSDVRSCSGSHGGAGSDATACRGFRHIVAAK